MLFTLSPAPFLLTHITYIHTEIHMLIHIYVTTKLVAFRTVFAVSTTANLIDPIALLNMPVQNGSHTAKEQSLPPQQQVTRP